MQHRAEARSSRNNVIPFGGFNKQSPKTIGRSSRYNKSEIDKCDSTPEKRKPSEYVIKVSDSDSLTRMLIQGLLAMEGKLNEILSILQAQRIEKEWYTTSEVAKAKGRSQYTVQQHWCNGGRIECEKDPDSKKWRIPGEEYRRVMGGGALKPKQKRKP